jgi:hypothetical protein
MKTKSWFVTLQQSEVEKCQTPAQLLVFTSIKSYCGNGTLEVGLSYRDIFKRSKYSLGWTKKVIDELKESGLVFTHGTETRRGGTVEVFSVGTVDTSQSVPPVIVSVPPVTLSVPSAGSKQDNIKNNKENNVKNILLSQHAIWEVANKNRCDISEVINTYQGVINLANREKYKIKDSKQTLNNWVRRGISKGTIETTTEFAPLELLKFQEPKGDKADQLVQPQ